jgi:hypothetical protein
MSISAQLGQIHYNTRFVNPKEFNSLWDFLKSQVERENGSA